MLNFLKETANKTYTENGAVTHATTNSDCLDLFGTIGALRHQSDEEIITRFLRAYTENPDLAMKILFYARDIRGGLGERKVFRVILRWLADNEPETLKHNLQYIKDFGRYDDLLTLVETPCEGAVMEYIQKQLNQDLTDLAHGKGVSLLAKWLPSINASNQETRHLALRIMKACGLSAAEYRRALSKLRRKIHIIENDLRVGDYSFDYEKQTSRSMFKHRKAFLRNDGDRYGDFMSKVSSGQAHLNADNVMPYELVETYIRKIYNPIGTAEFAEFDAVIGGADCATAIDLRTGDTVDVATASIAAGDSRMDVYRAVRQELQVLNATWQAMPDFGSDEDALAVIDTSGSMYFNRKPTPASVALSLGLYFAEHNKGAFRNHFIEFSRNPQLFEIKGETFADKLRYLMTFNKVADTNLESVFDLILETAVSNNLPQEELPAKLVIISDMEFNYCVSNGGMTNFQNAKEKFRRAGYKLPQVVFWNVASRNRQQPVTMNEAGVALVSGATPRLFGMVAGRELSPYKFMMEVVGSERYAKIVA